MERPWALYFVDFWGHSWELLQSYSYLFLLVKQVIESRPELMEGDL